MNDIFKDMQVKVGCEYISDLPYYKRKVWHEMKRLNPADYEERQLEDFSKYVFGMSYQTLKDVWLVRQFLFHLPYLTLFFRKNIASCNTFCFYLLFLQNIFYCFNCLMFSKN